MNAPLINEVEQWVQRKVETVLYFQVSKLVRDGLRVIHDKDDLLEIYEYIAIQIMAKESQPDSSAAARKTAENSPKV